MPSTFQIIHKILKVVKWPLKLIIAIFLQQKNFSFKHNNLQKTWHKRDFFWGVSLLKIRRGDHKTPFPRPDRRGENQLVLTKSPPLGLILLIWPEGKIFCSWLTYTSLSGHSLIVVHSSIPITVNKSSCSTNLLWNTLETCLETSLLPSLFISILC